MQSKLAVLIRNINKRLRRSNDLQWIRTSGFFDRDWYLAHNPDVAQAKVHPLLHFYQHGGSEGRDPGPNFSSRGYLDTYEDVRRADINPLVHYLQYGHKEGRKIQAHQEKQVEVVNLPAMLSVVEEKNSEAPVLRTSRAKVFCIGLNKTGTTSLERALMDFGYKFGVQVEAAGLMDDWAIRDFRRIVKFCESAEAFQDAPFSYDFTYQILDYAFPGSKFILTVRNSAEEWYQSLVRFHSQIMGVKGIPTVEDVKNFVVPPHEKGWAWRQQQQIFGATESTLYDEDLYKAYYTNHNRQVLEYFKYRPNDLLVLNLSYPDAMQSLCNFLDIEYTNQQMPYLNRSGE